MNSRCRWVHKHIYSYTFFVDPLKRKYMYSAFWLVDWYFRIGKKSQLANQSAFTTFAKVVYECIDRETVWNPPTSKLYTILSSRSTKKSGIQFICTYMIYVEQIMSFDLFANLKGRRSVAWSNDRFPRSLSSFLRKSFAFFNFVPSNQ